MSYKKQLWSELATLFVATISVGNSSAAEIRRRLHVLLCSLMLFHIQDMLTILYHN